MTDRAQQRMKVAPTLVEWGVRVASVALLVVLVGYLVSQGLQADRSPTFVAAPQLDGVEHAGSGYSLPVRVRNEGTVSVSELSVSVALWDGEEPIEEESIVMPFLGHGEETTIVVWFDADPRSHRVEIDIGSFAEP